MEELQRVQRATLSVQCWLSVLAGSYQWTSCACWPLVSCEQRWSPVGGEVLESGVLLRPEVLHGGLEGRVVAGHDVLLGLQGMLPLLPLPACAAYLGPPLAQRLLHPPVIPFTLFTTLQFGDLGSPV